MLTVVEMEGRKGEMAVVASSPGSFSRKWEKRACRSSLAAASGHFSATATTADLIFPFLPLSILSTVPVHG